MHKKRYDIAIKKNLLGVLKMRVLNKKFILDLKSGELKDLLQAVKQDDTLCLEIRENYINIYYRGGNMLRVIQRGIKYILVFDFNYCKHKTTLSKYEIRLQRNKTVCDWIDSIPYIKAEMDLWFYEHPKLEREYQQVILRDNNNSNIAGDTDYFIADIEYANSEYGCRFDLLGIKWISTQTARKNIELPSLAVMELKYGDNALDGTSGIRKHFSDIYGFFSNDATREAIYKDAEAMFNQKIVLGLIQGTKKQIQICRDIKPEYIIIFANHKPVKTILFRELKQALDDTPDIDNCINIKVATASYMGYGLYDKKTIDLHNFFKDELEFE